MKKHLIGVVISLMMIDALFSQVTSLQNGSDLSNPAISEPAQTIMGSRSLIASAAADYPVTPGDVYSLNYLISSQTIRTPVTVEGDYRVNLSFLGTFAARGLTFLELRRIIEKRVELNYPNSSPQLLIVSTGAFRVKLTGEFKRSDWFEAWGLSRLSDTIELATEYSSTRKVRVIGADGTTKDYDLFKASRSGDFSQDPYLRLGDTVFLIKSDRKITINGEVRRPGVYELLVGEELKELIEYYSGGLLFTAKGDQALLTRRSTDANPLGERRYIDVTKKGIFVLQDKDIVTIPSLDSYLPVVYYEGAISPINEKVGSDTKFASGVSETSAVKTGIAAQSGMATNTNVVEGSTKGIAAASSGYAGDFAELYAIDRQGLRKGELLSQSLRRNAERFLSSADLKRAFIVRKGKTETILVDIERILYAYNREEDIVLEAEDRIIIPFGSLSVYVTGEVTKSIWINAKTLMRLGEAITPLLTKYSSTRDIWIKGKNGDERYCDLFRAERFGEDDQNPVLKPGDTVTIRKLDRIVSVAGEVRRPGSYQLLKGEGLKELIEYYADGFAEKANIQRITLIRYVSSSSKVGERIQLDYTKQPGFPLSIQDSITVPPSQDLLPVIWFEGAIGVGVNGQAPQAAQRVFYNFFPGETLSQAVLVQRKMFSEVSDLESAYIVRDEKKIPVDIARLLFYNDQAADKILMPADKIVIPFRQFFVSVSGAVQSPGRYPYVPDRNWEYYVGLAGGFNTERNERQAIDIVDFLGKKHDKSRMIQPEDNIIAATNSIIYGFFRISTILTTAISLISLIISFSIIFK